MRVLVTGASGLIGRHACDALLVRGDEVTGLTRDVKRARATNPRVAWHEWIGTSEAPPPEAFTEVDAVLHLAGEPINQRLTKAAKERIRASRVDATRKLLEGLGKIQPKERPTIFVGQSAVGYYGDRGEAIVDESTPAGRDFLARICQDWEAASREAEDLGMRTVVLRTGHVLSPEGGLLKQLLLPFRLGVGGPLAGGRQYMPWVHMDDETAILLWAIDEKGASGTINATSPNPVTNREFSKTLGSVLRRPSVVPAPKLAVAMLRGGELADAVSGGQRVLPRRLLDLGYNFRFPELRPAMEDLLR